ncbi:YhdT family protein [Kroppenstedtia pulmonis]|uniref:YhdT family protein n=1 Tax=Kroppenstedtia pulmonis TaxID=1380685 RepID=A0A7D4C716_9BACL|nr:YhdT family protein [Kroppenstedtia pulmonis]QKG84696.1 YhdT family protein [Kroppenstedtia pulmonis]
MDPKRGSGDIYKDWRYQIAGREALIGVGLASIHFAWWFIFAYGLGSQPVEQYQYILGFPAWFFYSCVLGFVVFTGLVIITVNCLFREVPFHNPEQQREGSDGE